MERKVFFTKGGNQTELTIYKTGLTFVLNIPNVKLIKNLRFRKESNKFQRTLAKDVKKI